MLRILLFFVGVFAYGFFASSDIAANWMMDECNWSNGVIDSSLNRNDGVAYNGANTDSMGVVCRSGYFIADNKNYVEINNSSSLSVNTLTYMAWIKLDDPNYDRNKDGLENIFTNQAWSNALRYTEPSYWNSSNRNKILFQLSINGKVKYLFSSTAIVDTLWHHIAVTYNGIFMKIYIDGEEDSFLFAFGSVDVGPYKNMIGSEYGGYFFNGHVDEIKVFDKALSSKDIKTIYLNEKAGSSYDGSSRVCICPENGATLFNAVDYIPLTRCNSILNWDDNLTTEIVNDEFNLTILAKKGNGSYVANIKKVDLYLFDDFDNNLECNGSFEVVNICNGDCNYTNVSGCLELLGIKVNKASKCVLVHIEGVVGGDFNESNSSDDFAIRPFEFDFDKRNIVSGRDFNVTFRAVDKNLSKVKDYNETIFINSPSVALVAKEVKSGCSSGNLTKVSGGEFRDGEANITLNYSEIGEVNITVKEVNGSEFARVDSDDSGDERFIKPASRVFESNLSHFEIDGNLSNYSLFTYYDKDENVSALLDVLIFAKNDKNETLKNFSNECYGEDIDLNFSFEIVKYNDNLHLSKMLYFIEDANKTTSLINSVDLGSDVTLFYKDTNFSNGIGVLRMYINFDRNITFGANPLLLRVKSIEVNNSTTYDILEGNATFYYGYFSLDNVITSFDDINVSDYFLVYDENNSDTLLPSSKEFLYNFFFNPLHSLKDGNISEIVVSKDYNASNEIDDINVSVVSLKDGNVTFEIKRDGIVRFGVVHLLSPSLKWLWYNKFGFEYNISKNSTCLNHFCFTITYKNQNLKEVGSGEFKGVEVNLSDFNETKRGVKLFR